MIYANSVEPQPICRISKLDNNLCLFKKGENDPFAYRSYNNNKQTFISHQTDRPLFTIGAFSVYEKGSRLYCIYHGASTIIADITPLEAAQSQSVAEQKLEEYLTNAYRLDPYAISARIAFTRFDQLVSEAAEFCGCLTDILHDGSESVSTPSYSMSIKNINCEHIAVSLPIICLMFRRLSALRGFNFKVTVKDDLPCLIFSAKVVFEDEVSPQSVSEIREYSKLTEFLGDDGLIIGARLKKLDDDEDPCDAVCRLSIAICPQTVDPRGILRAPVWRQQAKNIIDTIDIDIEGKY
jgi:hypothetical protein